MNPRGILMLVLLVMGSGPLISQIAAKQGKAGPLEIAKVEAANIAKIEAGMALLLRIEGIPAEEKAKIDANYPVSKKGMVNLPFIGKIPAAGKTPKELAGDIEKAYVDAKVFKAPKIQIVPNLGGVPIVDVVHVGGQVQKPGPVEFADGMSVGDAIKAAGGPTEFGSLKRVKIFRDGKMTPHDLTEKENPAIPLQENDTIEVPQKNFFGE